jgi:hypothetical protein
MAQVPSFWAILSYISQISLMNSDNEVLDVTRETSASTMPFVVFFLFKASLSLEPKLHAISCLAEAVVPYCTLGAVHL